MHQKIILKYIYLISAAALVVFTKSAVACEELSIAKLQHMKKSELIKERCLHIKYANSYLKKKFMTLENIKLSACHTENTIKIHRVLKKNYSFNPDYFYKNNCKDK